MTKIDRIEGNKIIHLEFPEDKRLFSRYLNSQNINLWFDDGKLLSQEQMADVFLKAAKDFKAGSLSIDELTVICGNLYFGAYVQLDFYEKDRIDLRIIEAMREIADPDSETMDKEAAKHGRYMVNEEWRKKLLEFIE